MRHAGMHRLAGIGFPNGPANDALYMQMPGPLLMLDSEARWHIDRYRAAGRPVVWRSMAIPPATLGWSVSRYVDAVLVHTGEQQTSLDGGLIFANEWNLNGERGDHEDDWQDVERRYTFLNAQIIATAQMLRSRVRCELWYPAWSPHQFWRENVERWAPSVDAVDVLAFHEYETLEAIQDTYRWLRSRWPDKKLACTEWNCREGGESEIKRVLEWFARVEQDDPNFVGAYYFVGKWYPPADSWTPDLDVEGRPELVSLFLSPPTVQPAPIPAPEPTVPDYHAMTRAAAAVAGIDQDLFERQIGQECGWSPDVIECRRDSSAGARGIAQIVPRFHPGVDPCDPQAALAYAASLMASSVRTYGSYQKALIAYNWGPGNLSHWNGDPNTLPAETRHYLDVILGAGWPEPGGAPVTGIKLSEVLDRAHSREGDPYVWGGHAPGGLDCSGLVSLAYGGKLPAFTDAIFDATERVETPAPGDVILYEYSDTNQPGVRFPHTELFLSDTRCYGSRYPMGVGEHDQLPRSQARRYYRRAPNVIVDTVGGIPDPAPSPDFSVGGGILAAMQAHGDQPASDEVYVKHGDKDAWSEALGASGSLYRWVPAVGRVFRYDPAA
jgi:hypothetical protein